MSREKTRLFCPGTSDLNGTGKGLKQYVYSSVIFNIEHHDHLTGWVIVPDDNSVRWNTMQVFSVYRNLMLVVPWDLSKILVWILTFDAGIIFLNFSTHRI